LWNWNRFVKRNRPKFPQTVVQVWYPTTENIWLRLLLPKEGLPVIKSKGSHTFSNLHCECLHGVFNKDMKHYNCLCYYFKQTVLAYCCDLLWWSDQTLWPIYAEIQKGIQRVHKRFLPTVHAQTHALVSCQFREYKGLEHLSIPDHSTLGFITATKGRELF
jgi:hypothetical protein